DLAKYMDDPEGLDKAMENRNTRIYRMDVELLGANKKAQVLAEQQQTYVEQYYTVGCENGATAHTYQKITYKNVYPHIDWVLYVQGQQLKYDFIVHPGGNPADIRLQYKGATDLKIKGEALVATTPMGSITEQAPYSYVAGTQQAVASAYKLEEDVLRFNIAPYSGTLVIDPQLDWATYYGDVASDEGLGIGT